MNEMLQLEEGVLPNVLKEEHQRALARYEQQQITTLWCDASGGMKKHTALSVVSAHNLRVVWREIIRGKSNKAEEVAILRAIHYAQNTLFYQFGQGRFIIFSDGQGVFKRIANQCEAKVGEQYRGNVRRFDCDEQIRVCFRGRKYNLAHRPATLLQKSWKKGQQDKLKKVDTFMPLKFSCPQN